MFSNGSNLVDKNIIGLRGTYITSVASLHMLCVIIETAKICRGYLLESADGYPGLLLVEEWCVDGLTEKMGTCLNL